MNAQDIWKNMPKEENPIGRAPGILNEQKKPLTRNHLRMYTSITSVEDINKDTFLDYFDESTLNKVVPSTELYLPHLIFYDHYTDDQILALTSFIFDLVSCHLLTEDAGMNYLQCMFNRPESLYEGTVIELLEQGIQMGVNFDYRDNGWNSLLSWALVGNGYPGEISELYPYMPPSFHPDIEDGGYYDLNRDELTFTDLAKIALGKIHLNYVARSDKTYRDEKIESFQNFYKQAKNRNNPTYLLNVLLNHTNNLYLKEHLKAYGLSSIRSWETALSNFAGVFEKESLNTMGRYWKDKEKEKVLTRE